jgi:hypothetical protein
MVERFAATSAVIDDLKIATVQGARAAGRTFARRTAHQCAKDWPGRLRPVVGAKT